MTDNPKHAYGAAKASTGAIPGTALFYLGAVMKSGEDKYGLYNYREAGVSSRIYLDAINRHLWSWWDGEAVDKDSGLPHLAHVMACCAILLDCKEQSTLTDDRGRPGKLTDLIRVLGSSIPSPSVNPHPELDDSIGKEPGSRWERKDLCPECGRVIAKGQVCVACMEFWKITKTPVRTLKS